MITLSNLAPKKRYDLLLMHGKCAVPIDRGVVLASASGGGLVKYGARAHINIPISPLVKRDYLLVVRDRRKMQVVACGRIHNDAPI